MAEKLFLIFGLGVPGFCWLLAVQMRGLAGRALFLAGQDHFKTLPSDQVKLAVRAAPKSKAQALLSGDAKTASLWLKETYPKAVSHLLLARRASFISPIVLLGCVLFWRLVWGA